MLKRIYIFAWLMLIGFAANSIYSGTMNAWGILVVGLVTLGLVHALSLWAVLVNPREESQAER
jgi:hypothetical protein